jgi:prepilin-type N-terminal cleavage/methylation domain-containing protein
MTAGNKGLTLIEVLISILLLAIVAMFVAIAIPTSANLSTRTDQMETTTVLAQKYIEDVKATFNNNPSLFMDVEAGTTPPIDITDSHTMGGQYSITTVIPEGSIETRNYLEIADVPSLFTLSVTVAPIVDETVLTDSNQTVVITTKIRRTN